MPFDSKPTTTVAQRIRERLGPNGEHWCQGFHFLEHRMCILGALNIVCPASTERIYARGLLHKAAREQFGFRSVVAFNDNLTTTFRDVLAVLDSFEALELGKPNG
jgi:hypothetical protein